MKRIILALALSLVMTASSALAQPILYDQTANLSGDEFTSQDFTDAVLDDFDNQAADDFIIPPGESWSIEALDVPGAFSAAGPVDWVNIYFYADSAGIPGAVECSYLSVIPDSQVDGDLVITLPSACDLAEGIHWLSVQGALPFSTQGQWFWNTSSVQTNNGFVWQNPLDGWGYGCTSWTTATSCNSPDPDLGFIIRGTLLSEAEAVVPTMGQWGMLLFMTLAGMLSILRLKRQGMTV